MIMMLLDVIMLYWQLHTGIYEKRSSAKLWQVGIDLCLKYCKCLTNDISDDFLKLLCRGI